MRICPLNKHQPLLWLQFSAQILLNLTCLKSIDRTQNTHGSSQSPSWAADLGTLAEAVNLCPELQNCIKSSAVAWFQLRHKEPLQLFIPFSQNNFKNFFKREAQFTSPKWATNDAGGLCIVYWDYPRLHSVQWWPWRQNQLSCFLCLVQCLLKKKRILNSSLILQELCCFVQKPVFWPCADKMKICRSELELSKVSSSRLKTSRSLKRWFSS